MIQHLRRAGKFYIPHKKIIHQIFLYMSDIFDTRKRPGVPKNLQYILPGGCLSVLERECLEVCMLCRSEEVAKYFLNQAVFIYLAWRVTVEEAECGGSADARHKTGS